MYESPIEFDAATEYSSNEADDASCDSSCSLKKCSLEDRAKLVLSAELGESIYLVSPSRLPSGSTDAVADLSSNGMIILY